MKYEHSHWGWMLAADLFLGGAGGGLLVIAAGGELFLGIRAPAATGLTAAVLLTLGASLLVLELGRPLQSWRVFLNPRALLTVGAWMMLLGIGFGPVYASFGVPVFPWSSMTVLRLAAAAGCLLCGLGVSTYSGIFLGKMKGRSFWSGPGLTALFVLSALTTGAAALDVICYALPAGGESHFLPGLMTLLLALQGVLWPAYVVVRASSGTLHEAQAARRWLMGDKAAAFWVGIFGLGILVPFLLAGVGREPAMALADATALLGGLVMRLSVIAGDDRIWLPGEEAFAASLPRSDDPIFHTWS
jgi:protein NrfD